MCDWPRIEVIAYRDPKNHRGVFIAKDCPASPALQQLEKRKFDLVREWNAMVAYFDGWLPLHISAAIALRAVLFAKHEISAIEVVKYDFCEID
jgi:hypothetical protein